MALPPSKEDSYLTFVGLLWCGVAWFGSNPTWKKHTPYGISFWEWKLNTMRFGGDWTSQSSSENMTGCLGTYIEKEIASWYPKQAVLLRSFQLDDSKSLHGKWLFHQRSTLNSLFGVPGYNLDLPEIVTTSISAFVIIGWFSVGENFPCYGLPDSSPAATEKPKKKWRKNTSKRPKN